MCSSRHKFRQIWIKDNVSVGQSASNRIYRARTHTHTHMQECGSKAALQREGAVPLFKMNDDSNS